MQLMSHITTRLEYTRHVQRSACSNELYGYMHGDVPDIQVINSFENAAIALHGNLLTCLYYKYKSTDYVSYNSDSNDIQNWINVLCSVADPMKYLGRVSSFVVFENKLRDCFSKFKVFSNNYLDIHSDSIPLVRNSFVQNNNPSISHDVHSDTGNAVDVDVDSYSDETILCEVSLILLNKYSDIALRIELKLKPVRVSDMFDSGNV